MSRSLLPLALTLAVTLLCAETAPAVPLDMVEAARGRQPSDSMADRTKRTQFWVLEFGKLDQNGDRQLSREELQRSLLWPQRSANADALFRQLDQDRSGQVSWEEFQNLPLESWFRTLDQNGDGKVSLEELMGNRTGRTAERVKQMMQKMDQDVDNMISLEEFVDARSQAPAAKCGK